MQFGDLVIPAPMLAALEQAYAVPERAYHHWGHVQEVLRHYAEVGQGPGWQQPAEVGLAVLFHDAIYRPGRSDNEAASARHAGQQIEAWLPAGGVDVAAVVRMIELTARHGQHVREAFDANPAGRDVRHFLDCDMAILGADPMTFDAYDQAIAVEYAAVMPGWLFRIRRRTFLKGLLKSERIYLSDFFHDRLEAKARENLRRKLGLVQ